MYDITYAEYLDRVHGGWFGKCLGGAAGAPFEGIKKIIDSSRFEDTMDPTLPNDDLDMQLLWLEVLQKKGLWIDGTDLAKAWYEQCSYSMSEYGYFIKNWERGIQPPASGTFNNSFFSKGNGSPIRSEIWGFIFPGNPALASRHALMDGCLDHAGDSVYIEQFYAALESLAFFESDINKLIDKARKYIPADSETSRCIESMLHAHALYPGEPVRARETALKFFGHNDFTYSLTNLAFAMIGLLYGEGDIRRTINTALMCGYDTDCTCATATAILCETIGFSKIESSLKKLGGTDFVVGIDVKRSDNSIATLAREVCLVGVEAARAMNDECRIHTVPDSVKPVVREKPLPCLELGISYAGVPSIGVDDVMKFELVVKNGTGKPFTGSAVFSGIPDGWMVFLKECSVLLKPGESLRIPNSLQTGRNLPGIENRNLLSASVEDDRNRTVARIVFGVAGAAIWKMAGPFFDALDRPDADPGYPSPHPAGCLLPTLECMVNNVADIGKAYLDEAHIEEEILAKDYLIVNAHEDLIPVDAMVSYTGQACFYLSQKVFSDEERDAWLVIGNNDAYRLWMNGTEVQFRDENRLWTPYNNFTLVKLLKGDNLINLKLLRRTETLRFSIAFRKYEGKHWHQQRWITDLRSSL